MSVIRHWVVIDLNVFRSWADDVQISRARTIDNFDGTYGKAFELKSLPDEAFIAVSDTIKLAIKSGLAAVPSLYQAPARRLMAPPDLQTLVAEYGGYNKITPEAWEEWDAATKQWKQDVRLGNAEIEASPARAGGDRPACPGCGSEGFWGFKNKIGALVWYCDQHRPAKFWADAKR
jgi:hypothetical protein